MYVSLPLHPFTCDGHKSCFCLLAIENNTSVNTGIHTYLIESLLLILLGTFPEVELLDPMAILFLFLEGLHAVFHSSCNIYISTSKHK